MIIHPFSLIFFFFTCLFTLAFFYSYLTLSLKTNPIPSLSLFIGSFTPLTSISFLSASLPFSAARKGEMADCNGNQEFYASQDMEAASTNKKYGALAPKKKPLISKDNERAFFDSADWALCKQGAGVNQKSTVAIETLRPKLQRTPHQQLPPRRPACTSGSHAE